MVRDASAGVRDRPSRQGAGLVLVQDRIRTAAPMLFAAVAIVGGGGGAVSPGAAMIVQLAAIAALVASLALPAPVHVSRAAWGALALVVAAVALGLLQLVPLPAAMWGGLPGRAVAALSFALVSPPGTAHPLTLDPEATRRALLAMLPFAAGLLCTIRADHVLRYRLALLLTGLALADFLLGALQFASGGNPAFLPHATPHALAAVGFFANRNHNADLLLIAPMIAAALIRWDPLDRFRRVAPTRIALGLLLLFVLGVVIASSRMGLLLLAVAVPVTLGLAIRRPSVRTVGIVVAATVAIAAALALAAWLNPVAGRVFARFAATDEGRLVFWPEVMFALQSVWPWGSGLGTFADLYRSLEPLATVTPYFINHAHDEYLEVALEAGLPGVALMTLGLLLYVRLAAGHLLRAVRGRGDPLALAALAGILVLLMHSLVDYPLRTASLAALFGMLWGFCLDPLPPEPDPAGGD